MKNDAKLGLLCGVGGVVVSAVLLTQQPPAPQADEATRAVKQLPAAARPSESAAPAAARGKPEIEGRTTSRSARDDDE